MTGKLDQSLDEILSARPGAGARRRSQRRSTAGRPTPTAPVGGVQKKMKAPAAPKSAPTKAATAPGDSKIMISNLPKDVTEPMIKEYFVNSIGPVKKVEISYGPNGQSRGSAHVTFSRPDGASNAFKKVNGVLLDNKPLKIEIVVGNAEAEKVIPPAKSLADRVTKPKAQPKSAANNKHGANDKADATKNKRARRPRNGRPTKKTKEELDADMADYFVAPADNANANAPAPANGGDATMEDEIL